MTEKQAGVTALVTVFSRAYHSEKDSPKIFDDYWAKNWFSQQEWNFLSQSVSDLLGAMDPNLVARYPDQETALAYVMQTITGPVTLSRSMFTEDSLQDAVRRGINQYIILGAGFDSFAFRAPQWSEGLEIFELDHPVTQAMKLEKLANIGYKTPERVHFLPIDFEKEKLVDVLKSSQYHAETPVFISWLGVSYYLPYKTVMDTLGSIVKIASSGSELVFDYIDLQAFNLEEADHKELFKHSVVQQAGEPMKTGFNPTSLISDLTSLGLETVEDLSPDDIEQRFFQNRTDNYHASANTHFIKAKVLQLIITIFGSFS